MDFENILNTIRPFVVMFAALFVAFLTATWVAAVIWAFRDIRSRSRDIFAQILATLLVFVFFPLFPVPGLILYFLLRPRETLSDVYERSLEEEALLQGIEERMACPSCNRRIEEDFLVCPSCHTRLKKPCLACGRRLHLKWNICPYCGEPQTGARVSPPPAQAFVLPPEGEPESRMLAGAPASSLPEPETYGVDTPTEGILEDDAWVDPETGIIEGFGPYAESEMDDTWESLLEEGVEAEPETEEIPAFEPDAESGADADADAEALPEDEAEAEPETGTVDGPEPAAGPGADEEEAVEPIPEDDAEAEVGADADAGDEVGVDSEPDAEQTSVESD